MARLPKAITLTEPPEMAGEWDVEALEGGRLVLTPRTGPSVDELARRAGGRRLSEQEFEARYGDLPSDEEG